jgi:TrmH family RNA methyltransferase
VLTKAELQRLRSLRDKKNREELGLFVVEGEKVVGELLAAGFPFVELYATPQWSPGSAASVGSSTALPPRPEAAPSRVASNSAAAPVPPPIQTEVVSITPAEMARASHFPTPSSVLAVGKIARRALNPDILTHGLTLALDGVQDPGNVGTLLRIADWFAFDRVVLSPDCADIFHQKVINASMGSFARVTTYTAELAPALGQLRASFPGTSILGSDLEGDDVHTLPPLRDAVLVIGSEGRGLSPGVASHLTQRVTIPRHGRAESLNAAVAAAIVCDNLRRVTPRSSA